MLSHVRLLVTPWTVARQTPLSILQAGILEWVAMPSRGSSQPKSPSLRANSLPTELPGKCWRSLQKEQLYSQGERSDSLVMFSRNSHVWIEIVLFSAYALCPLNLVLLKNRMVQMPNSMMVFFFFFFFFFLYSSVPRHQTSRHIHEPYICKARALQKPGDQIPL